MGIKRGSCTRGAGTNKMPRKDERPRRLRSERKPNSVKRGVEDDEWPEGERDRHDLRHINERVGGKMCTLHPRAPRILFPLSTFTIQRKKGMEPRSTNVNRS